MIYHIKVIGWVLVEDETGVEEEILGERIAVARNINQVKNLIDDEIHANFAGLITVRIAAANGDIDPSVPSLLSWKKTYEYDIDLGYDEDPIDVAVQEEIDNLDELSLAEFEERLKHAPI